MKPLSFKKIINIDLIAVIILFILSFLFAQAYVNFSSHPSEDAAILMRYAKNIGDGNGIVWNVGEQPVDGGTDFLLMIFIAGLYKTGFSLEDSVRIIDFIAHFLTLLLVYFTPRRLFKSSAITAFIGASFFAIGPGLYYLATYFGTPLFALFVCLTWVAALKILQGNTGHANGAAFAFLGLVSGLIRPEGVILTGLMMVSIIFYLGFKKSKKPLIWLMVVFLVLGGAYFLWRWNYFGFPLPNPFYKKGGIHPTSLKLSIGYVFTFGLPFWIIYILGLFNKRSIKLTLSCLMPIVGFTMAFVLLSNEMNFAARFQYALLSLILISWQPIFKSLINKPERSLFKIFPVWVNTVISFVILTILVLLAFYQINDYRQNAVYFKDGRYDMAGYLNQYKGKGYWLASSEAGLLPLYSEWNSIDTWGLNDQWIAHHGMITEDYLARYKPEIIMFHAYFSPVSPNDDQNPSDPWSAMDQVLKKYAENNGYKLAAVFGVKPDDTHYYYVKNDFPDSERITNAIRAFDYLYYREGVGGEKSNNYALY